MSSKQAWIERRKSFPREVKHFYGAPETIKVRLHGDTALVVYHAKQFNEIGGQTTFVHNWQIETHIRQNGRWLLVGVADGVIPPEPVAAKIDATIFDAYVGEYEWAPNFVSKVECEGDKLMLQLAGDKSELPPESETSFFTPGTASKGDTARYVFVKDANGRATHYIYREFGATDQVVKKVK